MACIVDKTGAGKGLVSGCDVSAAKISKGTGFAVGGEAQHKRPNQHPYVDFSVTKDDIALVRDVSNMC